MQQPKPALSRGHLRNAIPMRGDPSECGHDRISGRIRDIDQIGKAGAVYAGGLRTDPRARVVRADGSVIPGLYAAGNSSAAVMGHSYAGAGSTIGPAMTFGYIAANDLADGA